jgi:hypothetical protein
MAPNDLILKDKSLNNKEAYLTFEGFSERNFLRTVT